MSNIGQNYNWNIRANLTGTSYSWLSLNTTSGSVSANETQDLTVNFDASELENGSYSANIIIESNDPDTPVITIPVTMDIVTGMNEIRESGISIYPNPANDVLSVSIEGVQSYPTSFIIYNSIGHKIEEKSFTGSASIDISSYPAGVYFMKVNTGNTTQMHKVIIR